MKIFKISIVALLLSATFIACKKERDFAVQEAKTDPIVKEVSPVIGTWIGEYITTSRSAPVYLSFKIKANGTLDLLNAANEKKGSGTWTLHGLIFNAAYIVDATQEVSKVVGDLTLLPSKKLNGQWQYDMPYEDTGYWYMDKVSD